LGAIHLRFWWGFSRGGLWDAEGVDPWRAAQGLGVLPEGGRGTRGRCLVLQKRLAHTVLYGGHSGVAESVECSREHRLLMDFHRRSATMQRR
jgi:hypothetical protein